MTRNITLITVFALIMPGAVVAHDAIKHKGKPVQGEVVSVAADRFELKTDTAIIPVTFSSKTKFEHGDAVVDKTHVTKGERVQVFGTKLPNGELVAREVLIGAPAKPAESPRGHTKAPPAKAKTTDPGGATR